MSAINWSAFTSAGSSIASVSVNIGNTGKNLVDGVGKIFKKKDK